MRDKNLTYLLIFYFGSCLGLYFFCTSKNYIIQNLVITAKVATPYHKVHILLSIWGK